MIIQTAFPTPFGFAEVSGDWTTLANLETFNSEYFGQTHGSLHEDEPWKPLAEQLLNHANEYNKECGYMTPLKISNMWLNKYEGFNSIHPHFHSNSLFSCVLYILGDSGTVFYRPVPVALQSSEYSDSGFFYDDYTVAPKPNGVVFFPSTIRHTSIPSQNLRYTISANFNAVSYGNKETLNQLS